MLTCKFNSVVKRKMEIKRPKFLQNYIDFQFPPQNFRQQIFYDFKDLNEQLLRIGLKIGFYRGRIFQRKDFQKSNAKRLIYTCKQKICPSKLCYLWTGDNRPILCQFFDNIHYHKKSNNPEKQKRQKVHQFILDMPYNENWQNYKRWMYEFDINDKDAKFIVQQLFWYNNTENEIFSRMAFEGKIIRRIKDAQGNTICVFIVTDTMKKNYLQYGEVINFDTTTRMVTKCSPYGSLYSVGYFMAQDTNLRLAIVGICFFIQNQKPILKQIFQYFFDLVCQKIMPYVIFTNQSNLMAQVITQLKEQFGYKFQHLVDWYHITQMLRDKLEQQPKGPQVFQLFCQALGECSVDVYQAKLSQIQMKLKKKQILSIFKKNQRKYSVCKLNTVNLNFGILYKYSRKLNQRINQCIVFQTFKGRFFFTLLHFQKILLRLLEKVTVINQGLMKNVECQIHMLTMKLENHVMEQLLKYYTDSLQEDLILVKVKQEDPLNYCIYSKANESKGLNTKYYLHYSLEHDHWQCSCKIQYLNGLPCCHIFKILKHLNVGLAEYYINTRWIHDKQDRIPEFSKPLISRKRRRV